MLGITTSEVGVVAATGRPPGAGCLGGAFEVRDGTDNGLADASFDRVWVMESSHLMRDAAKLLSSARGCCGPGAGWRCAT